MPADRPGSEPGESSLVHRDRRNGGSASPWVRSFACDDMSVLIVCRGPIRKEAIDVFREMGMSRVGMLLSERDSIVFPRALAPELRIMDPSCVHAVPDYTGATKEERQERIGQIIEICQQHGYGFVFAGYGFMAEDASFVRALEEAGLRFVGPCSHTQMAAGAKDEAKRTAIENQVSVTPGLNDVTVRTLLRKASTHAALAKLAAQHGIDAPGLRDQKVALPTLAEQLLEASYRQHVDLFTIEELAESVGVEAARLLAENPGRRFRLKAIGGGGGKGQRIFQRADVVAGLVREVLSEVKATGKGDNKNMLIELNVESTRHNEIQILGNGQWCIALGGRDCSLQMHEQKLVEVSITQEGLEASIEAARKSGSALKATVLESDLSVLRRMETEAERFGQAVKLDSASTFECIVEGDHHYFMEVNTRIQVEHRVSELCYALRFTNPDDPRDYFDVHSLVEAMGLVARTWRAAAAACRECPVRERPSRYDSTPPTAPSSRLRASVIISWSDPIPGEIRDDQGISLKNPDTGLFMRYGLAGAYDSNIALLLATGESREQSWTNLTEVLRRTTIRGIDLATNHEFLYGLMHWFQARDPWAKPTTAFVVPYLTLVGELAQEAQSIDLDYAFHQIERRAVAAAAPETRAATAKAFALKETLAERPIRLLVRRAAPSLGVALTAPARLRRRADAAWSGSETRSRCSPRPTGCCTSTSEIRRPPTASGTTTPSCSTPRSPSTRSSPSGSPRASRGRRSTASSALRSRPSASLHRSGSAFGRRTQATSSASRSSRCSRWSPRRSASTTSRWKTTSASASPSACSTESCRRRCAACSCRLLRPDPTRSSRRWAACSTTARRRTYRRSSKKADTSRRARRSTSSK